MEQDAEKFLDLITKMCEQYGWVIALGPEDSDGNASGMILGTPEYVDDVIAGVYSDDESNS